MDTRDKRAAALVLALAIGRVFPNPDGALAQADRQQAGLSYPGILVSAAVVPSISVTDVDAVALTATAVDAVGLSSTAVDAVDAW